MKVSDAVTVLDCPGHYVATLNVTAAVSKDDPDARAEAARRLVAQVVKMAGEEHAAKR